jgi:hypothetical protein
MPARRIRHPTRPRRSVSSPSGSTSAGATEGQAFLCCRRRREDLHRRALPRRGAALGRLQGPLASPHAPPPRASIPLLPAGSRSTSCSATLCSRGCPASTSTSALVRSRRSWSSRSSSPQAARTRRAPRRSSRELTSGTSRSRSRRSRPSEPLCRSTFGGWAAAALLREEAHREAVGATIRAPTPRRGRGLLVRRRERAPSQHGRARGRRLDRGPGDDRGPPRGGPLPRLRNPPPCLVGDPARSRRSAPAHPLVTHGGRGRTRGHARQEPRHRVALRPERPSPARGPGRGGAAGACARRHRAVRVPRREPECGVEGRSRCRPLGREARVHRAGGRPGDARVLPGGCRDHRLAHARHVRRAQPGRRPGLPGTPT